MTTVTFLSILQNFNLQTSQDFIVVLGSNLLEPFNQIQGRIQSLTPEQGIPGNQILTMRITNTSGSIPQSQLYTSYISLDKIASLVGAIPTLSTVTAL